MKGYSKRDFFTMPWVFIGIVDSLGLWWRSGYNLHVMTFGLFWTILGLTTITWLYKIITEE